MDKLRVGIVTNPDKLATNGGSFSYYQTLLNGIDRFCFDKQIEIVILVFYNKNKPETPFSKKSVFIKVSALDQIRKKIVNKEPSFIEYMLKKNSIVKLSYKYFREKEDRKVEDILIQNQIDLIYYLGQESGIYNYPFIATHWDVGHKSMYPFPAVAMNGIYESREENYSYRLNKALLILCESEAGLKELKHYYSYYQPKLKTLPIFASDIIKLSFSEERQKEILAKNQLEKLNFFIYPAQFWPHKNHYNLVIAFAHLVSKPGNGDIKLVLCGSDKGNMDYIKALVVSLSLQKNVLITGFVQNEDVYSFYKNAIALVLPSFLGPTNMPLIEAAHLQCPVLCSDFEGHREIMGEHALYFDPAKADEIEKVMQQSIDFSDRGLWSENARQHIVVSKFNLHKSLEVLNNVLLEIIPIRKVWGINSRIF